MHRSGTSVMAKLLHAHGLWRGAPADMEARTPHNPDGHFEHMGLRHVNDAVLAAFGGTWDRPPEFPESWEHSPELEPVRREAAAVIAAFPDRPWGFKDPRTSLTLPFWRDLVGSATYVVCLRHPFEVADSLQRRNQMPPEQALRLWEQHYRAVLAATSPEERLVVAYDDLCDHPVEVSADLLGRLPLPLAPVSPDAARDAVSPALRHHRATEAAEPELPGAIADLYAALRAEAPALRATARSADPAELALEEIRRIIPALASLDLAVRQLQVESSHLCWMADRLRDSLRDIEEKLP
jgi:hypothetical protein